MTAHEINDVKSFLKNRFIATSSEWIEACINFVKEEHTGQNLQINVLRDFVYNQWLNADLEEIGASALPAHIETSQKMTLNGCYGLQVNSLRDVGKPAYAQLKELNKHANVNEGFSAAPEPSIPPWESKPTRMLMLKLTDGCITLQGMEYKPISALSLALTPGIKVLIQGPVDCRFGVVLLTPEKIKILGGEVESKLEQCSQKAILRELLNVSPEENQAELDPLSINHTNQPIQDYGLNSVSTVPENRNPREQNQASSSRSYSASNATSGRTNNNFNQNDISRRNIFAKQRGNVTNQIQGNSLFQNQSNLQNNAMDDDMDAFDDDDDDFVQSLNYDAIDELEKENNITTSDNFRDAPIEDDIWQEDEDVLQDLMAFQNENPGFEMPFEESEDNSRLRRESGVSKDKPFTYLSSILNENQSDCLVTIKGFIIRVLSKLECTVDKGWNLCVKINDGTATLDANIHDKVLENIIGLSAVEMLKIQKQADPEKRKEAATAISKCKVTLQDYSCLMDIQFSSGSKPCIVKCHPVTQLEIKQLLERVQAQF